MIKPSDKCDKAFVVSFSKAYSAYCVENGISIANVCRSVKSKGLANMYEGKLYSWAWGKVDRPVYVYTLNVLCEEIGLKLMDFVSVRVPTEYVEVRPELLRKKPKP